MRVSTSFVKFARFLCVAMVLIAMVACKGRTLENVEADGDTIEVVISQPTIETDTINNTITTE